MNFSSDNAGPAAPEIIEAIAKANDGYAKAYGADELTESLQRKIREIFDAPEAAVQLVATGTAANSLALACLCPPWATVYCHRNSHVEEDECGAPEFFTGGSKLTLLDGLHAKIQLQSFKDAVSSTARAGVHNVQAGAFSITNSTENGTAYTREEVSALCGFGRREPIAVPYGRCAFRQCVGHDRGRAIGTLLEGRGGHAFTRRYEKRTYRRGGRRDIRPVEGVGV